MGYLAILSVQGPASILANFVALPVKVAFQILNVFLSAGCESLARQV